MTVKQFPMGYKRAFFPFATADRAGGAIAPSVAFVAADFRIYKDGFNSKRTGVAGLTVNSSADGLAGLNGITIDLSDNSDAGFYVPNEWYTVTLAPATATVDSQVVVSVVGEFLITATKQAAVISSGVTPTQQQFQINEAFVDKLFWIGQGVKFLTGNNAGHYGIVTDATTSAGGWTLLTTTKFPQVAAVDDVIEITSRT